MRHGEQCGPDAHRFHNKTTVHAELVEAAQGFDKLER